MNHIEVLCSDEGFLCLKRKFSKIFPSKNRGFDHIIHGLSLQQFHHHKRAFLIDADIEDRDDVRVLQCRESARFLGQLIRCFRIRAVGIARNDALQSNFTMQHLIVGQVDGAKSTLPEFAANLITTSQHYAGESA